MDLEQVIKYLSCPITHQIFHEPVVASDGHTYEKEAIFEIFDGSRISPISLVRIRAPFHPNLLIQEQIKQLLIRYPGLEEMQFIPNLTIEELEKKILDHGRFRKQFSLQRLSEEYLKQILLDLEYFLPWIEDLNLPCRDQITLLQYASREGHLEAIKELIKAGATNSLTKKWITPFGLAIFYHQRPIVSYFLNNGHDIDEVCDDSVNSLTFCAYRHNIEGIKICLEHGADAKIVNLGHFVTNRFDHRVFHMIISGLSLIEIVNDLRYKIEELFYILENIKRWQTPHYKEYFRDMEGFHRQLSPHRSEVKVYLRIEWG